MIFAVFDPSPLTVCINCSFSTYSGVLPSFLASEDKSAWPTVERCLRDDKFSGFDRTPTCDRQPDTQRDRQTHTHRSRAIVFTALAWHRAVKLTINTVATSSVLSVTHYSCHITSHGEDGCRPQWPLYPRNNCLSYDFVNMCV